MNTETTGFRSLVQQIQERDHAFEPPIAERERGPARDMKTPREPRRDLPRRTRNSRNDGMEGAFSKPSEKQTTDGTLLDRRWL